MLQREIQRISELIQEYFDAASELPPERRGPFLDACLNSANESDVAIRSEVERLLRFHERAGLLDEALWETPPGDIEGAAGAALEPGEIVAQRFRITRMIGSGGMGEVYEAEDLVAGQTVALKTIRSDMAGDAAQAERFRRELLISRNIGHRNVCRVYEYGEIARDGKGSLRFFTMELLRGETLAQRIATCGRLPAEKALSILEQVAAGLEEVHRSGIIHRDLKPSNIFLVQEGDDGQERAVVMDFGLARNLTEADLRQTRSGMVMGTLLYIPPELPKTVGVFTDIYSLGIVALEMVTGAPSPVVPPRTIVPGLDPAWDQTVLACVGADVGKRPKSALEVVAMLRRRTRPWRRMTVTAAVVVGCVAAGDAAWNWVNPRPVRAPMATQLTFDQGLTTDPAATADGKLLVYASDRGPRGDVNIWLQRMDTGEARQLTDDPGDEDEPDISPDGKLFAYTAEKENKVYVKPVSGGTPRLLAKWSDDPRFSPDGSQLAYWTGKSLDSTTASGQIWLAPVGGGIAKRIASEFADARFPAWSRDGRSILFRGAQSAYPSLESNTEWWVADVSTGRVSSTGAITRIRGAGLAPHASPMLWDGSRVIFAARSGHSTNLWSLGLTSILGKAFGAPHALTTGAGLQQGPAVLSDGRVAYSSWRSQVHVWKVSTKGGGLEQVTFQDSLDTRVSVSRDGNTVVFGRRLGGNRNIWVKDMRTGIERELAGDELAVPVVSPSGRTVAFSIGKSVHLLDIASGARTSVYPDCGELLGWTPDESHLVYRVDPISTIQEVDINSRERRDLIEGADVHEVSVSPISTMVAFSARQNGLHSRVFVATLASDGTAKRWQPVSAADVWSDKPVWSDDGRTIYYHSKLDGFECLWSQRITTDGLPLGSSVPLHHFHAATFTMSHLNDVALGIAQASGKVFLSVSSDEANLWAIQQ